MPLPRLALPIVLCTLALVGAVAPGTTATATLRMTPGLRAAIAREEHPDLWAVPGVPGPAPAQLLAARRATRTPPATAAGTAALQRHMAHELALAGPQSGAYVYDLSDGQALFAERAGQRWVPASVEKLFTAVTALERMGPGARLETTVLGAGHLGPGGVWQGNLYLRGGGDPTLGSAAFDRARYGGMGTTLTALVAQLRAAGVRRVTGQVEGDESVFDSLRGEPSSGYAWDPYLEGTLSALAFNRGETGHERGAHAPAAWAARRLRAALRAAGVAVGGHAQPGGGAATAPAGAVRLAEVRSPTIAQLLGLTLPPSDNFFAETLLKDLGARFGGSPASSGTTAGVSATGSGGAGTPTTGTPAASPGGAGTPTTGAPAAGPGGASAPTGVPADSGSAGAPTTGEPALVQGTTARGAHVVRETLAELGLHPRAVDGSGLSTEDQTSPYEVVTLLTAMAHTPLGTILRNDMAVAGHTGTLAERMRGTAAAGRCQGKTGTLTSVSNLAGYCEAADGEELAYAFFDDGIPIAKAHTLQDSMAITLARY